jgi:hypothetical protein
VKNLGWLALTLTQQSQTRTVYVIFTQEPLTVDHFNSDVAGNSTVWSVENHSIPQRLGCHNGEDVTTLDGVEKRVQFSSRRAYNIRMNPLSTAATALGLANSAVSAVKSAYELTKKTSDMELKHQMSAVMDTVLDLKAKIIELDEENRTLREQLEQKDRVVRTGEFGYWFKEGEKDPLCPKCYEESGKTIYLTASEPWSGGVRRDCRVCNCTYWEQPIRVQTGSIRPHNPWS